MSTGGNLAWVQRRAKNPKYSTDDELHKLKVAYEDRHNTFNPVMAKTAAWKTEGKRLQGMLNAYKTNNNVPIHTRKGKSQKGGTHSKHDHTHHTHDQNIEMANFVAQAAKNLFGDKTPSHAQDASTSKHLDHVTNNYQNLKNKVKNLLKSKIKNFTEGSFQYTQLKNIETDMKSQILKIETSAATQERKTQLKKEIYNSILTRTLRVEESHTVSDTFRRDAVGRTVVQDGLRDR
jgi:hypothetical protein